MNYPEALAYLQSALSFGIKPGLERMIELTADLGYKLFDPCLLYT